MVQKILGLTEPVKPDDVADALVARLLPDQSSDDVVLVVKQLTAGRGDGSVANFSSSSMPSRHKPSRPAPRSTRSPMSRAILRTT